VSSYNIIVDPDTGMIDVRILARQSSSYGGYSSFIMFPPHPEKVCLAPKYKYDMEMTLAFKIYKSLNRGSLKHMLDTMANSDPAFHITKVADIYTDAVARSIEHVNGLEWLYEFQKETVRAMIRHETVEDGAASLYGTRLTGEPFGAGVFLTSNDRDSKYVDSAFAARYLKKTAGFLAHEPGMGKTRQCIALIQATRHRVTTPTLVVVPPSIMFQWRDEIKRLWPEAEMYIYHGKYKNEYTMEEAFEECDVVLTTYSTLSPNIGLFAHRQWGRIIVDESHAMPAIFINGVGVLGQHKWCVTGTPDINLKKQLTWLLRDTIWMSIERAANRDWPDTNMMQQTQEVWRLLRPIMFRKTTAMHLNLPDVYEHTVTVELSHEERVKYDEVRRHVRSRYPNGFYSVISATRYYNMLQGVATMGCHADKILNMECHTETMQNDFFSDHAFDTNLLPDEDDAACPICLEEFENICMTRCNHFFCTECLNIHITRTYPGHTHRVKCPLCRGEIGPKSILKSPAVEQSDTPMEEEGTAATETCMESRKLVRMFADIERILEADVQSKVLVFFPHMYMLKWFQEELCRRMGCQCLSVTGKDTITKRSKNFKTFQTSTSPEHRIMLMTTRAAASGINLTEADHILTATPCIQKSLEEQLIGRSNRIGRGDRPVHFYRYVGAHTVEEKVVEYTPIYRSNVLVNVVNEMIGEMYE
jgi:SNF2 family DNA or RNA helicase